MSNRPRDEFGRFIPVGPLAGGDFTGFEGTTGGFSPSLSASSSFPSPLDSASQAASKTLSTASGGSDQATVQPGDSDFEDADEVEDQLEDPPLQPPSGDPLTQPLSSGGPPSMDDFFNRMMQSFATALASSASPPAPRSSKIPALEIFDGLHPEKLRSFLFQGELNFRDRPLS